MFLQVYDDLAFYSFNVLQLMGNMLVESLYCYITGENYKNTDYLKYTLGINKIY